MKIEFDPDKGVTNLVKRGLSLADSGRVYHAPNRVTLRSLRTEEDRVLDIALVEMMGVVLALVYVERNDVVRAISLRRASRQERRLCQ